jgi:hypothetical protein
LTEALHLPRWQRAVEHRDAGSTVRLRRQNRLDKSLILEWIKGVVE